MCLRGCNRGSARLISPVPYHRPTPACLFPTSRQLGGIDASCLRDRIQTATFLVPFLSPPFPAWNRFTHLASCLLHKDEKSPVVVFSTLGLAPVFFLPSWCLCLRLGCCVPTLVVVRGETTTEPVRGRPPIATALNVSGKKLDRREVESHETSSHTVTKLLIKLQCTGNFVGVSGDELSRNSRPAGRA